MNEFRSSLLDPQCQCLAAFIAQLDRVHLKRHMRLAHCGLSPKYTKGYALLCDVCVCVLEVM